MKQLPGTTARESEASGYTAFNNALLMWMVRAPLSGSEFRLLLVILRQTTGWHKPTDRISVVQFHEATSLHKQVIARGLRTLALRGYLIAEGDAHHPKRYSLQVDYRLWDNGKVYTDSLTDTEDRCKPIDLQVNTEQFTDVYTERFTTKETKETSIRTTSLAPAESILNSTTRVETSAPPQPHRTTCLTAAQLADFERWWPVYPKHSGRKEAEVEWQRVNPDGRLTGEIIAGTEQQKTGRKWREGFIREPHRFLHDERWRDEPEPDRLQLAPRPTQADHNRGSQGKVVL